MTAAALARNLIIASVAIGTIFLSFDTRSQAAPRRLPPVLRAISDEVGALSVPEGQALASILADVKQKSGVEIIVVVAETTGAESIEEYTQRLSAHWRAYGRSPDGERRVFVVVAVADCSLRIASEKQMASVVEQVTKSPLMTDLLPMFRHGEYFRALALIVEQLSRAIGSLPSAGDNAT